MAASEYWVHVQQPTVPHYREPFFDKLYDGLRGRLLVSASRTVIDGPPSVSSDREYLDLSHDCSALLGRRAYWQKNMLPLPTARPGDVAVICANPRYLSTFRFALAARRIGMGVVWWGHGWSPTSKAWATHVRRMLMTTADAVLLYTDAEVAHWRAQLPRRIPVIGAQNAIDQSRTLRECKAWTPSRLAQFKRQQNLDEKKILLFCGRLRTSPYTGVELLLMALAKLVVFDTSYLVVIIGDGEDRERLQAFATELGVSRYVRWLGAQFDESLNAPWFLSALCFTYPGPIGLSILHAMGYGVPVVTHGNRRRHNPEIAVMRDGYNGLEFQDGSSDDLAEKIAKLAEDQSLKRGMSENASKTAHIEYTIESMADRFLTAADRARERCVK